MVLVAKAARSSRLRVRAIGPFPTCYAAYRDALGIRNNPTQFGRRITTGTGFAVQVPQTMRNGAEEQIASELATAAAGAPVKSLQKPGRYQALMSTIGGEGGIRTPDRLAPMPHFECGAFDHSATSPGAITGARPRSGRVLGEDGGPDKARGANFRSRVNPTADNGGTARRDKNRRSRVASLKLRPGSAASLANLSDGLDGSNPPAIGNAICVLT